MSKIKQNLKELLNSEEELKLSEQEFVVILNTKFSQLKINSYTNRIPKALILLIYKYWCLQNPKFKWKYTNTVQLPQYDQHHFLYLFGLAVDYLNEQRKKSPIYDKKQMIRYLVKCNIDSNTFIKMEKSDWCNLFRNSKFDLKINISYGSMVKLKAFMIDFKMNNLEIGSECVIPLIYQIYSK